MQVDIKMKMKVEWKDEPHPIFKATISIINDMRQRVWMLGHTRVLVLGLCSDETFKEAGSTQPSPKLINPAQSITTVDSIDLPSIFGRVQFIFDIKIEGQQGVFTILTKPFFLIQKAKLN